MSELLEEQRDRVTELTAFTDHIKLEVSAGYLRAKEEECKSLRAEVEHPNQVSIFHKSHKTMTAKLNVEGTQNQKLREQLVFLRHRSDDLGGKGPVLRKTTGCRELNDREQGIGGPSLLSEVEVLRRRVVEMEGKDEELIRMGDQCRDLDRRLTKEALHCSSLKAEVDKLNGRINELDRIEEALRRSKQECSSLKGSLEREREVSKTLSGELDNLRTRLRELEASEGRLEKSEAVIKHDLAQLRSLTVALVEDRKTMADRLRQAEEKLSRKDGKKNEQSNLATMTERLKEERQQAAKAKADLEERIKGIAKEKDELQARLKTEEERNSELEGKITILKRRLQVFENRKEKEEKRESVRYSSSPINTKYHRQTEDNKVNELSQEVDRLRKILRDKEALEGELMKVEEDFESLERQFKEEQSRSEALTEELEVAKRELSRYQQAEKQEVNQEHLLLCRLQREQVKSRLLSREVETLKEKLQKLLGTEESICKVQTDHSTLQRKLSQQEARNRELAREMNELTSELDRHKKMKKLTSVTNRAELDQTSKEVQTEPVDSLPNDFNCKATLMHTQNLDNDEDDPNQNAEVDSSTIIHNLNSLNSANNNISVYSSHGDNGIDAQPVNREVMMLTHTPGQPLHIKVTPHHILNTATLEISSPTADSATSYTSTAVIPTSGAPPKQRITIIQNSALSAINTRSPPSSPDRSVSSLNGSPIARVLSPTSSRCVTPDHNSSPIQIVTVRTCSPEPSEVANQIGFSKTLERQSSWKHERSNSIDKSPSITTTAEDNKIHIHLGSPYIQSLNGVSHSIPHPVGPYYVRHEQRTQVLANGCHVKGVGKITSSITISPATSPATHSSNITVSGLCD